MGKQVRYLALIALLVGAAQVRAQDFEWIRAAYWDSRYPGAWGGNGVATRDALAAAGYEVLDADELKVWMDARIADKAYSVVVFCLDVVPDTVCETMTATCTLRRYLNAGGKVVWYSDWPFYYQGAADGSMVTWTGSGATSILGFDASTGPNDSYTTVTITPDGQRWGLTQTWESRRPTSPTVTDNLTVLALDGNNNAAAWAKHYVPSDKFRGFVRIYDRAGAPDAEELMRVAEYACLKASNPQPPDGATGIIQPLVQWDPGSFALWHDVYFGTDPEPPLIGRQMWALYYHPAGLEAGTTYYWRIDEVSADAVTVYEGDLWSFTAAPYTAYAPIPRNGDKWITLDTALAWTAGKNAISHELYFGTDGDAVASRDASVFAGKLGAPTYAPAALQEDTTYYWVIDEIDNSDTRHEGELWSFTTIGAGGGGVKGEYFNNMTATGTPMLTRIDPAVDFDWGDPGGPGTPIGVDNFSARWSADLEIAAADTYTFITRTDDGARLYLNGELIIDQWVDQSPTDAFSQPLELEPGIYTLIMEYYENGGGAVAQLAWETPFVPRQIIPGGPLQPPVRAKALYPQNDAVDIPQNVTLMWSAGEKAGQHLIYLGDDEDAVTNATPASAGIYRGQQGLNQTTYTLSGLEWNKTYYWRIDEANAIDPESPWKGGTWSFTTADFINVDDFEVYTNDVGNRVFQTWIDGLGYTEPAPGHPGNGTGALVGHDIWSPESPYYEGQIVEVVDVHGGSQAMPLYYDNTASPYVSEAERTWTTTQNWAVNDVTDLSIWFHGSPAGFLQNGTDSFTMSASGTDIWGTADEFRFAYKLLNGNGSIVARVDSIANTNEWAKGGVMIRESLDAGAKHAMVVVTPAQGIQFTWRDFVNADMTEHSTQGGLTAPYWVKLTRNGNTFTAERSEDGVAWVPVTDAAGSSHTVTMIGNVYIGLALTSHNAAAVTVAEFSNVNTTGTVTGQWQVAEIGVDHPENDAGDVYVRLEDNLGRTATVPYPNGAVVPNWTEWKIPLADFVGVSMNAIKKMVLGVGDPVARTPDGSGMVLFDDIRVVKPAEATE